MPKAAYSEEDRERIRTDLVRAGLELMAKQGSIRLWSRYIEKLGFRGRSFILSSQQKKI